MCMSSRFKWNKQYLCIFDVRRSLRQGYGVSYQCYISRKLLSCTDRRGWACPCRQWWQVSAWHPQLPSGNPPAMQVHKHILRLTSAPPCEVIDSNYWGSGSINYKGRRPIWRIITRSSEVPCLRVKGLNKFFTLFVHSPLSTCTNKPEACPVQSRQHSRHRPWK